MALRFDLEGVQRFGLNMVRLHQKVNAERWYYHADVLGVVVFQDAVQKYGGATAATVPLFVADLVSMIEGRGNHPCIVQWEAFNEGDCWGVCCLCGCLHLGTCTPISLSAVVSLCASALVGCM